MAHQSLTKTQEIIRKIDELIRKNKISWLEVLKELERKKITLPKKKDVWEEVKGMWSKKKIDPLRFERRIRKELERFPFR